MTVVDLQGSDSALSARSLLAQEIAIEAGTLARDFFENRETLIIEEKRHPQDLVSEADKSVEQFIRSKIAESFPADGQIGEEFGYSKGTTGFDWVIDPIDGTAPFLNGMPGWCVSVGLMEQSEIVGGVIHAPILQETFSAQKGGGTFLNGKRVNITDQLTLQSGLLGVGANDRVSPAEIAKLFESLMNSGASWVRYGSGALMLAWVAAGRLVGYIEPRMSIWDCCAAYCLINEAGGTTRDLPGEEHILEAFPVLGANSSVFEEIRDLV